MAALPNQKLLSIDLMTSHYSKEYNVMRDGDPFSYKCNSTRIMAVAFLSLFPVANYHRLCELYRREFYLSHGFSLRSNGLHLKITGLHLMITFGLAVSPVIVGYHCAPET